MKLQVKTAYAYLRVGSVQLYTPKTSINAQRKGVKSFCRRNNIRLVDIFVDCPASANNFHRDGLVKMLGRNVIKPVDYIVMTNTDRLSRDFREYINLKNQLSKLGTQIRFSGEPAVVLIEEIVKITDLLYSKVKRKRNKNCVNG